MQIPIIESGRILSEFHFASVYLGSGSVTEKWLFLSSGIDLFMGNIMKYIFL